MNIALGSKNPVKIEATRRAFSRAFRKCQVIGVEVESEVSDMPQTFKELVKGAKNRAQKAQKQTNADFGVGLEGGIRKTKYGSFLEGFAAVVNKEGKWGLGESGGPRIPQELAKKIDQGKELGKVMDEIRGQRDTKKKNGAVGFLTKDLVPRTKSFERAILFALSPFIRPELFNKEF